MRGFDAFSMAGGPCRGSRESKGERGFKSSAGLQLKS